MPTRSANRNYAAKLHLTAILLACLSLWSCDSPNDPRSTVSSVEISPSSSPPFDWIALRTAEEIQLYAEVTHADGSIASGVPVMWRSTAPELAIVDATGLVRTAATYAPCGNYSVPFGCGVSITATADGSTDTVAVLVQPRIQLEGTPQITLLVGDSVTVVAAAPVATVDVEVRCTFFPGPVYPEEIVRRSSSGYILAVAPGQGYVGWLPAHNLCRSMPYTTSIRVLPRE